jgi:hypothetical protein
MDFGDMDRKDLVVQDVWYTQDGWQHRMYPHEVNRAERRGEHILYFSLAEFAVTGQYMSLSPVRVSLSYGGIAQAVLKQFTDQHYLSKRYRALAKSERAYLKHSEKFLGGHTGALYSVLSRNCQDWADYMLENMSEQSWDDHRRLKQAWDPHEWLQTSHSWLDVPPSRKWDRVSRAIQPPLEFGLKTITYLTVMRMIVRALAL